MRNAFLIEVLAEDGVWRSEGEHYATLYDSRDAAETARSTKHADGSFDFGGGALSRDDTRVTELKMAPAMTSWLVRDGAVFIGICSAPDEDSAMECAISMAVTAGIEYSETLTWERLS